MTPTDTPAAQPLSAAVTPVAQPASAAITSSTSTLAPAVPISTPAAQPQPNQETFAIDALALFHTYTRDSYSAAFGVDAPAWDATRLGKSWFDSTVDTSNLANVANYLTIGQDPTGAWAVLPYTMPVSEAATVNIAGAIVYPPYVVAPTGATRGGSPLNPNYLSLEATAQALMTSLSGTGLFDDGATVVYPNVYPPDEPRRSWSFLLNGLALNAGLLLLAQNANGVGAPGHWNVTSAGPTWVADPLPPSGLDDTRIPRPVPVRPLLPNEQLEPGPTGFGVQVLRTDLQLAAAQESGAFMPEDRAMLSQILAIVSKPAGS
jgi:hypothetical protein